MSVDFERIAPMFFVRTREPGSATERIDLTGKVESFSFEDDEKKADKLSLKVDNFTLEGFDSSFWRTGREIEFSWGYASGFAPPRGGIIKKVTGGTELTIEAHGKAILMAKDTKTRSFDSKSYSQIVTEIAATHGYVGTKTQIQNTEVVYETVTQARMSDAQFLRHLANRQGFEYFVDLGVLHWHRADFVQRPIRKLTYYNDISGEILSFGVEGDLTAKPGRVRMKGRDPETKEPIEGVGDDKTTKEESTLAALLEVVAPLTGSVETVDPADIHNATEITLPTSATSKEEATQQAKGQYLRGARTTVKLKLVCIGDPSVLAKSVIEVAGLGAKLSGKWYVTKAKHTVEKSGYKMTLDCRRGGANAIAGAGNKPSGQPTEGKTNDKAPNEGDSLGERVGQNGEIEYVDDPRGQ